LYLNPLGDYLRRAGAGQETLSCFRADSAMVTFWIRQDHQDTRLAGTVVEGISTWLGAEWPLQTYLFRILPGELSSRAALERLQLRQVHLRLPGEARPYLWFQPR
jgi:hypothetical protein